jgi:hypothetical protein
VQLGGSRVLGRIAQPPETQASMSRATPTIERSVSSTPDERSKAICSKVCACTTPTSQSLHEQTDWISRPRENAGRQTMTTLQVEWQW